MKILVIADSKTCTAFGLAGFSGRPVASAAEAGALLTGLTRPEAGLVLITEALAEKNRNLVERLLTEPGRPLILEIPDMGGPRPGKPKTTERLFDLLRR
jgi:vacuolar-type H+-ATPase subunit F/Vma7